MALIRNVDPITFEVLSHRLHQITREMGITLERTGGTVTTTFETETRPTAGHAQALAMEVGKGRVVVCGEAAMLSAQVDAKSGQKFGMNIDGIDNRQFVLNTLRWLARELP